MKVSIVVPTFNQGAYIEECLQSIALQTHRNLEVIIQDSMSRDETETVCRDFIEKDPRFKYFREKDKGQSDAINRGLARSTGDLWTWICSDDFYSDQRAIENLIFALGRSPDPDVIGVFGLARFVNEKGGHVADYPQSHRDLLQKDFQTRWPLSQPSSLLLRKAVKDVGGVDPSLYLGMDLELFCNVLKKGGRFRFTPFPVAAVRLQGESKSVVYRRKTAETALSIVNFYFGGVGSFFRNQYLKEYGISRRKELGQTLKNPFRSVKRRIKRALKPVIVPQWLRFMSYCGVELDEHLTPVQGYYPWFINVPKMGYHFSVLGFYWSLGFAMYPVKVCLFFALDSRYKLAYLKEGNYSVYRPLPRIDGLTTGQIPPALARGSKPGTLHHQVS